MRPCGGLAVVAAACVLAACSNPAAMVGNYGTISGRITNTAGQPVANATIVVDSVIQATSGADGSYVVTGVPVTDQLSPATVSVNPPPGYAPPPQQTVQVKANQTTANVNFVLSPA